MSKSINLSKIALGALILFPGCKEFIEPSIEDKKVVLLAPSAGTESSNYNQTFWWEGVEDALEYQLQVVTPHFNNISRLLLDTIVTTDKFTYTLDPGEYEWRVKALNGSSQTAFTVNSFTIYPTSIKQQQVQLQAPGNNLMTNQPNTLFKWLKLFGGDKYILQIDTNNFADESVLFLNQTTPNLEFPVSFTRDKIYQWRVKAQNDTAESKWSVIQKITFDATPPTQVFLSSPADNQVVAKPVALRWEAVNGAKNYKLYVYKSDGSTPYNSSFPATVTATSYTFNAGVTGERIFWELRAVDEVGNAGPFSEQRAFVIQ